MTARRGVLLGLLFLGAGPADDCVPGPHGLTGCVIREDIPDYGPQPTKLVISRHGKPVRTIQGEPFVWQWRFLDDGRDVAIEAGPLHFAMACRLLEIASGKERAAVECFSPDDLKRAPAWVHRLLGE